MQQTHLHPSNLDHLPDGLVLPGFELNGRQPGIIHLGPGNFARAHIARFTHILMERKSPGALRWAIVGAGLLPADSRIVEALKPQAGLYTLVERDGRDETATIIGSICDVLYGGDSTAPMLLAIDRAGVRIVSLTVTEGGYCLDADKRLDTTLSAIIRDLEHPRTPKTAIGVIVEGLRRRMESNRPAFTALSCDNIQSNGNVLKRAIGDFARLIDPTLSAWVDEHGRFPNTMVDRITPATTAADIEALGARYGVNDAWPVFCEGFRQWVIEDEFADGRPTWEDVGAQFVTDVAPYEFMKLRLLNGSHLAIAGLGELLGYKYVDETMRDELLRRYMMALMDRETGPTLPAVPGIDLEAYKRTLLDRFANAAIKDTVERVNTDAPLNVLLDPIRDRLLKNESVDLLALGLAAWMRRIQVATERGRLLVTKHPAADQIILAAGNLDMDPRPFLAIKPLFGDLGLSDRLAAAVKRWLSSFREEGVAETIGRAVGSA